MSMAYQNDRRRTPPPRVSRVQVGDMDRTGTIKWFDDDKRFGFIKTASGTDVFLHFSVLKKYGLNSRQLVEGVKVRFKLDDAPRGARPEAAAIALA